MSIIDLYRSNSYPTQFIFLDHYPILFSLLLNLLLLANLILNLAKRHRIILKRRLPKQAPNLRCHKCFILLLRLPHQLRLSITHMRNRSMLKPD